MNRIRSEADGLAQVSGLSPEQQRDGRVHLFVLPADDQRTESLQLVRSWLDNETGVGTWTADDAEAGAKILVIAHRMAARRLGFENLYAAFHDSGSRSLSESFDEGTAWPIAPFTDVILPLADASGPALVSLLRRHSPALQDEGLKDRDVCEVLAELRRCVSELSEAVRAGGPASVGRVLEQAASGQLVALDPRMAAYRAQAQPEGGVVISDSTVTALDRFMQCDISELRGYQRYVNEESPYSTHQGVKGAEFPRVLVVLDDVDGRHNQFSYEKLLGIRALSKTDLENQGAGRETVVERTRRLFYVCCSRATEALGVVLYTDNVDAAVAALRSSGLPGADEAVTLADLAAAGEAGAAALVTSAR